MKKLLIIATVSAGLFGSAMNFHSHTPHACPRNGHNPNAHCNHQGSSLKPQGDSPAPDCSPGVNCGEGLDGCVCSFSCVFGQNRSKLWTVANLKAWLAQI